MRAMLPVGFLFADYEPAPSLCFLGLAAGVATANCSRAAQTSPNVHSFRTLYCKQYSHMFLERMLCNIFVNKTRLTLAASTKSPLKSA